MPHLDATASAPTTVVRPTRWSGLWTGFKEVVKRPLYRLYEARLDAKARHWRRPRHIGIIMDGNRRFAVESGLGHVRYGHARGARKLREVLDWCFELDIPVVTVWSFSLDNLERDPEEVAALYELFEKETRDLLDHSEVHENRIRVRYLGRLELLPESLRQAIAEVERVTADYDRFQLNIAMAYGGREEITDAFREYLEDHRNRGRSLEEILEDYDHRHIEPYLYTCGQPEPDLIVRTSGEVRLSGFLLWQSAYSEYYFCDALWPAFRKIDLLRALRSFDRRRRRFGR